MPAKAVITTPFPTVEETAKEMGVTKRRVHQLRRLMIAIVEGRDGRVVRFLGVGRTVVSKGKKRAAAKRSLAKRKQASHR